MAKRKSSVSDSVDFEELIDESEIFKKVTKPSKPTTTPDSLIMKLIPLKFEKKEQTEPIASFSQSFEMPCSSKQVTIVPSEPGVVASLTSELQIKQEESEGEDYTILYYDESMPEVKNEPNDEEKDKLDKNYEENEQETTANNEGKYVAEFKPIKWTLDSSSMRCLLFKKKQGFLIEMPTEPFDIFRLFLNDDLLNFIVKSTNKNAKNCESWTTLSRSELLIFIGLLIHTGTIRLQRIADYWNSHYLFNIKSFCRFMKYERFMQLLIYISFSNNTGRIFQRHRIQPVIDHFNQKMNSIYYPGVNLIVTKSIAINNKQIVMNDENRPEQNESNDAAMRMTTIHMLAEQTGIVLKLNVTPSPLKFYPYTVVSDLLAEKLNNGHSIYLSESYCSFYMAVSLLKLGTLCTGPLIINENDQHIKKSLEAIVTQEDLYNKNGSYFSDGIHLCRVNNQFYVSSQYDDELLHLPTSKGVLTVKQKLITMYDSVMEVDLEKDLWELYPMRDNDLSWPKKVFIHVLQLALLNAHKFYNILFDRCMSFYSFRIEVLEKILPISDARFENDPNKHELVKIGMFRMGKRMGIDGQVYRCKMPMRKQCKGCQKTRLVMTMFECRSCPGSPGYCVTCFERCHKQESLSTRSFDDMTDIESPVDSTDPTC